MPDNDFSICMMNTPRGVIIDFEITAGSPVSSVFGVNKWRERIKTSIAAKAKDGAANREMLRFLAGVFGVPSSSIQLVSGEKSSQKRVEVAGMNVDVAVKKLEAALGRC
ncbi:MAG: DUF167 domain-containing protein [Methanobacteriota archaeon]